MIKIITKKEHKATIKMKIGFKLTILTPIISLLLLCFGKIISNSPFGSSYKSFFIFFNTPFERKDCKLKIINSNHFILKKGNFKLLTLRKLTFD